MTCCDGFRQLPPDRCPVAPELFSDLLTRQPLANECDHVVAILPRWLGGWFVQQVPRRLAIMAAAGDRFEVNDRLADAAMRLDRAQFQYRRIDIDLLALRDP